MNSRWPQIFSERPKALSSAERRRAEIHSLSEERANRPGILARAVRVLRDRAIVRTGRK